MLAEQSLVQEMGMTLDSLLLDWVWAICVMIYEIEVCLHRINDEKQIHHR